MKTHALLSAALILLTSTANAAIDEAAEAKCSQVKGDLARLECYDTLAKKLNVGKKTSSTPQSVGTGKWEVEVETNPVDDSKTVTAYLAADSGKNRWNRPVVAIARCQSNSTDFFISWGDYLAGDGADVLTRIGSNPATTEEWSLSTNKKATFKEKPITFLKKMAKEDKLVTQVTPFNQSPVTAIFDIRGLDEALKPLREACNW